SLMSQPNWYYGFDTLDINNWKLLINASNTNFLDPYYAISLSNIPKDSGINVINCNNLWIAGLDDNEQLHVSADKCCSNTVCFTPGPFADTYDSIFYDKYNRVWKVNKSEITYHINHWNDLGYTMPEVIENWPGNGNMANGEAPVLAPYIDANGNSIYDPQNGDYPYILGDQAIYTILNDDAVLDSTLCVSPVGIELHVLVYAFQDTGVINNTFLIHFDIIKHSSNNYHNVLLGLNSDFDIGNAFDDYVGCDTTQNLYFGYNGDSLDEKYGTHPPAVGALFLNKQLYSFMYYNFSSNIFDRDPKNGFDYYNYMNAIWRDSIHLSHHGNGHDTLSFTDSCNFAYPEFSNWTEVTENDTAGDRRSVGSTFIGNLNSCTTFDIAYVWSHDTINSDNSVGLLLSQVSGVQQFYNQLNIDTSCNYLTIYNSINNPYSKIEYFNIFPNPATDIVTVKTNLKDYTLSVYSQLGQKVFEQKNIEQIDVSSLNAGIYLIQIVSGNKTDWRKLVVE
ncbi:MAG: T9SS type A sorting domain-containing protein, partial [Bacteroidales bacterium]|nr:T9SS type A sorting domain-containing protein [Bacteroidales bacterium]